MGLMLIHVAWATLREPGFLQALAHSFLETVFLRVLD